MSADFNNPIRDLEGGTGGAVVASFEGAGAVRLLIVATMRAGVDVTAGRTVFAGAGPGGVTALEAGLVALVGDGGGSATLGTGVDSLDLTVVFGNWTWCGRRIWQVLGVVRRNDAGQTYWNHRQC